jgi:hypothetical protein
VAKLHVTLRPHLLRRIIKDVEKVGPLTAAVVGLQLTAGAVGSGHC